MTAVSPQLQYPPRPIDAAARRCAWSEPRVRSWVLLAAVMGVVLAALLVRQYLRHRGESRLVTQGVPVGARVLAIDQDTTPGQQATAQPPQAIRIEYDANGSRHEYFGYLPGFDTGVAIVGGDPLPIRFDPADPKQFTARLRSTPVFEPTSAVLLLAPGIVIVAAVALVRRRKLLATWKTGDLVTAVVLDAGNVAVAPSARGARCTPADDRDSRLFHVYVPRGADGPVSRGSVVSVIARADGKGPAVAAAWFDRCRPKATSAAS